jgi:hypothetical protein
MTSAQSGGSTRTVFPADRMRRAGKAERRINGGRHV